MKRSTKTKLLGGIGLLTGVVLLSSCTANFCSNSDKANIAYTYDEGVTLYCDKDQVPSGYKSLAWQVFEGNDNLWAYIPVDGSGNYAAAKADYFNTNVIKAAKTKGYTVPSQEYFKQIDQKVLETTISQFNADNPSKAYSLTTIKASDINTWNYVDTNGDSTDAQPDVKENNGVLRQYGYLKFLGKNSSGDLTLWANWDTWTSELRNSTESELGYSNVPSDDFTTLYKNVINTKLSSARGCVATVDGNYGHYGEKSNWKVSIEGKSWSYAWSKGFLEGLIVYPVALMVDNFAYSMDPTLSGFGQIWSIVLVTLIIRVILLALTFKSTLDQQKMQALQPELSKLQAKYPNSNTNRSEQARLSQEQMALYKRHKIQPASSIVALIIQFPVFIAVWSALEGSSALTTGSFLNLRLSDSIQTALFNTTGTWWLNTTGWWTALVLFLIMSVTQFVSMMLPQWITKYRNKNNPKLSKNPAQDKASSQMKWMSYGMLIFTIIMGFFLPAAMGVYWAIGALISMIQTAITQAVMIKKQKNRGI